MSNPTFSIVITTKNRLNDLVFTLNKIKYLIDRSDVECVVFDDGSTDGTSDYIKSKYPNIILKNNQVSKGLIFCRNKMLDETEAKYAISLDDDANFLSKNVLETIEKHFLQNPKCGVIACRIFWGKSKPKTMYCDQKNERVKAFVGCGHIWNMKAWREIPNYPEWFVFYGEEDFSAFQLYKKNRWEVQYVPQILVQHRVDIKSRKNDSDYRIRTRRSFRSGWYLYFLFYPWKVIPKKILYTLYIQIRNKTLQGDYRATLGILQAIGDVLINFPKLIKESNRLSQTEYYSFINLPNTKIYWMPRKA